MWPAVCQPSWEIVCKTGSPTTLGGYLGSRCEKNSEGFFCPWTWVLQRRYEVRAASQAPVPSGPAKGWAPFLPGPAGNVGSAFPAPGGVQTRKAVCGGDGLGGPTPGLSVSWGSVCR